MSEENTQNRRENHVEDTQSNREKIALYNAINAIQDINALRPKDNLGFAIETAAETAILNLMKISDRNCDVGTAKEQVSRHGGYCARKSLSIRQCDPGKKNCWVCYATWLQQPYEPEGGTP